MLELKNLTLHVPAKPEPLTLLSEIDLAIRPGEFVAIVGSSGCGKSTLLKCIAGLTEISTGSLFWEGRDLELDGDFAPGEIGYIPQFSIAYELLTVEENILSNMRLRARHRNTTALKAATGALLHQVGLHELAHRQVRLLSGGQRRRLALALELVTAPALLLCDEVTSGLDPKAEDELVLLLQALARQRACTVLSVTHSLAHLAAYDSVIVLHRGHLAYHGPPEHITHYFRLKEPSGLYAQLEQRSGEEWNRSWQKHGTAFIAAGETKEKPGLALAAAAIPDSAGIATAPEESTTKAASPDAKKQPKRPAGQAIPGVTSQFFTLLGRRWKLFFRDRGAIFLQLLLVLGFPALVVIFALNGLPQIRNLSATHSGNIVELLRENAAFVAEASRAGTLVSGLVMFQVVLLTLMASNNAAREIAGERLLFEKEKFGGVSPGAYVASKVAFLLGIVLVQSLWMTFFVKAICGFPGNALAQAGMLLALNGAMTAICLGISSLSRTPEQASITSIYLVGFQLPLSGAVLALPEALGPIARPLISSYWGWSGYLQTLRDTRLYDVVQAISLTPLKPAILCLWVLLGHIVIGLFAAHVGSRRSQWPQ